MEKLIFNENLHEYRLNGEIIPGVTEVLNPLINYSMVPRDKLDRALKLGSAVHKMTELYDNDDLDEESLSDELKPYLKGWKNFRFQSGFKPILVEKKLFHPILKYAGTLDRTGEISGETCVLDIKKMMVMGPVVGVQLAAYKELCGASNFKVEDRYGLGLRVDGTFRLNKFEDASDWPAFLALLTLRNWKLKNKHKTELNFGKEI